MRYLTSFFFTLLFTHNVFAGNLCDASCEFTITFPEGGSIEAVEALTFTFGDGGFVNDGVVTTGYSSGDTLSLVAGESLIFQSSGSLELGMPGNLDYTNISITNGIIELAAIGGSEIVSIYQMMLTGELQFDMNSDITVVETGTLNLSGTNITFNFSDGVVLNNYGTMTISSNVTFAGSGTVWIDTVNWSNPDDCNTATSSSTITVSGSATATVGNTSCAGGSIIANTVVLSPLGGSSITFTPATLTGMSNITLNGGGISPVITTVDITGTIEIITQEFLSSLPDGIEFATEDGNTCTLTAGDCITATGAKYVVVDGKLVPPAADGSGLINLAGLFAIFVLLSTFRFAGFSSRN